MKRRLSKLALFLTLGAIVNISVAWGLAYTYLGKMYKRSNEYTPETSKEICLRHNIIASEIPDTIFGGYYFFCFGHKLSYVFARSQSNGVSGHVVYYGWPFYSMSLIIHYSSNDVEYESVWIEPWGAKQHLIPLGPIWPGFAINTVFYAAIMWIPSAPFHIRRYLRKRRGHCIKCGYDLRGNSGGDVCPECGSEIASPI